MRVRTWVVSFLVFPVLVASGCQRLDRASVLATNLRQIVEGPPVLPVEASVWTDVQAFYGSREARPAWVTERGGTSKAEQGLHVLRTAPEHGLDASDYGDKQIAAQIAALGDDGQPKASGQDEFDRLQQLATLDAQLTTALLALGRDVAVGRTMPTAIDRRWKARRVKPDLVGALASVSADGVKSWLLTVRPQHPEYAALQRALIDLRAQKSKGGWPKVPPGVYAPGKANSSLSVLRERLAAAGYLVQAKAIDTPPLLSSEDQAAIKAFQSHHQLEATGNANAATLAAMNVPIDDRIRQVEMNLERWRWMPDDFGARHFFINIPYFHLIARENGRAVRDIRVVVGKPEQRTPVFSSQMETVVFSPYWNIPDSIVEGETVPALARDSGYLSRNNIEILRMSNSGAVRVDPSSVDWADENQIRALAFRQRPGPGNALGHVKFLFPNQYDVYLHDTPADNLFARPGRAFSHGCIRVEEPEALAKYVLRGYSEWDDARILEAMHSGVEKHVRLKEAVPVHVVYFTAWVDEKGGLHFQPDIYGYDAAHAAAVELASQHF